MTKHFETLNIELRVTHNDPFLYENCVSSSKRSRSTIGKSLPCQASAKRFKNQSINHMFLTGDSRISNDKGTDWPAKGEQ